MRIRLFVFFFLCFFLTSSALAERPQHDGKVVLFGNLHAHSALSDDVPQELMDEMSPKTAFEYAHQHGLDFLAITDHHKGKGTSASNYLKITPQEYKNQLFDVAMTYNASHPGQFFAIPGIEWGTISKGNHVNVFGAKTIPDPDAIKEKEYDKLFTWASNNAEFIQFNHPSSWGRKSNRDKSIGNFGEKLYSTQSNFVSSTDPVVKTISIITSVRGGHISGRFSHFDSKTHREAALENQYKKYLNMGFHISPSANQDTHFTNWGTVTAARTAAWAGSASYRSLMNAFKANRVYATEDDEMVVAYQVRYKNKNHWMGDTVKLGADSANVELRVKVWQADGSDGDKTDEGPYTIEILSDHDGIGKRRAAVWDTKENVPGGQLTKWGDIPVVDGEYIYIRVTEENGKDNPVGEGDDEFNNRTGHSGPDGKRDDMNDSAWTAPIWFVK